MCLVIHSDGHLTIKMLHEQIWPRILNGNLQFLECYDIVFRWHMDGPLKKLYVLSPNRPADGSKDGVFSLLPDASVGHCDWIFEKESFPGTPTRFRLGLVGPVEDPMLEFDVTYVRPELCQAGWVRAAKDNSARSFAAFEATGMTVAEVRFGDELPIRKYDPQTPAETTYYVRLAFQPEIQHLTEEPIPFGAKATQPLFRVQPCAILSPCQVLNKLSSELDRLEAETALGPAAKQAKVEIVDGVFRRPGTSTRIEDHRISLVTPGNFVVLNSSVRGDCAPLVIEPRELGKPVGLVRNCVTGGKYYPHSDPLTLAREVYRYLRETAVSEPDAKSKEAISAALSCRSHYNVSHVVEALKALGFVRSAPDKENLYLVAPPILDGEQLFMRRVRGANELDFGTRDKSIRDCFFGELQVPLKTGDRSRFRYEGFYIFYDLAFCLPQADGKTDD